MCEHGDRRVTRMENNGTKTPLATHFNVSETHVTRSFLSCDTIRRCDVLFIIYASFCVLLWYAHAVYDIYIFLVFSFGDDSDILLEVSSLITEF